MAAITWTMVKAFDSSLSSVDVDAQADILAYVNAMNSSGFGGDTPKYKLARLYMAAHLGVMWMIAAGLTGAGDVRSETIGPNGITIAYDVSTAAQGDELDATEHGQAYKLIAATSLSRLPFVPGACR